MKKRTVARRRHASRHDPLPSRFVAIDASSHAVGWAMFTNGNLAACGAFSTRADDLVDRVARLSQSLVGSLLRHVVIDRNNPDYPALVCEVASGLRHAGKTSPRTTATLGFAQGFVAASLANHGFRPVVLVPDNAWPGGMDKRKRQAFMIASEPVYAAFAPRDKGADAADAVGLGLHVIRMEEFRNV